jgi:short chain dehydrogenase
MATMCGLLPGILSGGHVAAEELGARLLVLDVTNGALVDAAAKTVADATGGSLDVLINNAGIAGGLIAAGELTASHLQMVYDVHVLGPVRMLHAFLPLLERPTSPDVVKVSSGLGSLTHSADPESTYSTLSVPATFRPGRRCTCSPLSTSRRFPECASTRDPPLSCHELTSVGRSSCSTRSSPRALQLQTARNDLARKVS